MTSPTFPVRSMGMMILLLAGQFTAPHFAWLSDLSSRNGSHVKGSLEMYGGASKDSTIIELELKGDRPRSLRAWSVGRGTCSAPSQETLGKRVSYPALRIASNGTVKIEARLAVVLPDSGDFFVGVYESAAAKSRLLACGNLYLED